MFKSYIVENSNITRLVVGWGRGYVVIPDGTILHGITTRDLVNIEVHGGVTWAESARRTGSKLHWVKDSDWIIGFDTSHGGDNPTNQDIEYVQAQTNKLLIELTLLEKELKRK